MANDDSRALWLPLSVAQALFADRAKKMPLFLRMDAARDEALAAACLPGAAEWFPRWPSFFEALFHLALRAAVGVGAASAGSAFLARTRAGRHAAENGDGGEEQGDILHGKLGGWNDKPE
jgi:hypothetical protein